MVMVYDTKYGYDNIIRYQGIYAGACMYVSIDIDRIVYHGPLSGNRLQPTASSALQTYHSIGYYTLILALIAVYLDSYNLSMNAFPPPLPKFNVFATSAPSEVSVSYYYILSSVTVMTSICTG